MGLFGDESSHNFEPISWTPPLETREWRSRHVWAEHRPILTRVFVLTLSVVALSTAFYVAVGRSPRSFPVVAATVVGVGALGYFLYVYFAASICGSSIRMTKSGLGPNHGMNSIKWDSMLGFLVTENEAEPKLLWIACPAFAWSASHIARVVSGRKSKHSRWRPVPLPEDPELRARVIGRIESIVDRISESPEPTREELLADFKHLSTPFGRELGFGRAHLAGTLVFVVGCAALIDYLILWQRVTSAVNPMVLGLGVALMVFGPGKLAGVRKFGRDAFARPRRIQAMQVIDLVVGGGVITLSLAFLELDHTYFGPP